MAGGAGLGFLVVVLALAAVGFGTSGLAIVMRKETRAQCSDAAGLAIIAFVVGGFLPALGTIEALSNPDDRGLLLILSGCWLSTNSGAALLALVVSNRRRQKFLD